MIIQRPNLFSNVLQNSPYGIYRYRHTQYRNLITALAIKKYLEVGKQTSEEIDSHLSEGRMQLKLQRSGLRKDTRYHIIPVS
jgi:hypothetical protein